MSTPHDSINALFDRVSAKVMQVADERNEAIGLLSLVWKEYGATGTISAATLELIHEFLEEVIGE